VVWWIFSWSRIMRRRMLVWCVVGVVVVGRRRMRRMMLCVVVWLRRRMRMTHVDLEGDVSLSSSAFPVESSRASCLPLLHELVDGPGCCGGELHGGGGGGGGHWYVSRLLC
jgi:hypothetical protein